MLTATREMPMPTPTVRSPDWYRSATRWTQLTFVEDDPLHFDPDFWIQTMRETKSNALCLSAGGYIAFYPTKIPFHHRSKHLGETDPFGVLVEGARSLDMQVMARVDPHAIHADAAEAHPEWLAHDYDGKPIEHWAFPGIWLTDPFSTYHSEFTTEVAREIVREYDVDALFANRWEGSGIVSYSEGTRKRFFDDTGVHLPPPGQPDHDAWPVYSRWRSQKLSELVVLWDDAVKEVKPHVRFIPNRGAMLTRDLVRDMVDDHYPMFFIDKQGRSLTEAIWAPGRIGKRSRGMFPDRPVSLITSVGPEHHDYRWKDSVADPHEVLTWMVDGFAHGALPWYTKFNAHSFDTRWVGPITEAFALQARTEDLFASMTITAEVVVLDNVRIDPRSSSGAYAAPTPDEDGFYQALVEARIPFDYIADQELSLERLSAYEVLLLPNCNALSAAHVETIRDFVALGGSVVAAYESSLTDDQGERRSDLGLGELLGVTLTAPTRGPVKNNYIEITDDHPVSQGYVGTSRIVGGTHLVPVEAHPGTRVPFRFVPDYPDLPMEEVFPREAARDAALVTREHPGGGRTVYAAFDLGSLFWTTMQTDHARLITNSVRWALGGDPRVSVDGLGLLDVAVRSNGQAMAVALVNLNNPMAMRGVFRESIPLPPQELSVALPAGATGATARLVIADHDVPVEVADGRASLTVPTVDVLEVVHLTWLG